MYAKLATMALLTALGSTTLAQAQGQNGAGAPMAMFIEEWDQNADGVITLDDIATRRTDIFVMFDQSGDGMIDAEEQGMMAETIASAEADKAGGGHGPGGPGQLIHGAMTLAYNDTDADGMISAAEFDAASPRLFAELDSNGDGSVTPADFGH